MALIDRYGRAITYLRISVTDRCNLRCVYCMPAEGIHLRSHEEILRYEEIVRIVRVAVGMGIRFVRLTGGEPLVRKELVKLVRMLRAIPGLEELSMTTNGTLLADHAQALAEAGLDRVNISLDSLRPERFHRITRLGNLSDVLKGIEAAERAGLVPLKLNTVVMRGLNDDEVVELARLTLEHGWHVRFIEPMPVGSRTLWDGIRYVPGSEVRDRIEEALGSLRSTQGPKGHGPARNFKLPRSLGTVGFITPWSENFCASCNRMRLTADGRIRPCLLSDIEVDLRGPLRLSR
ncbi:MAG: GTP 3',8-cyclase MoaA, partial [Chloroflexota bacterium]|nr:GTP 3',8-cyclase MoaA [Chloroflexota bacterium]